MTETQQSDEIRFELESILASNEYNLGKAFRAISSGITAIPELIELGAGANPGAAANLVASLNAILERKLPKSPSRSIQTGRWIGGILRSNPNMSRECRIYLQDLRTELEQIAADENAQKIEQSNLAAASNNLEVEVERKGGVYVYTFPTYLKTIIKEDPDRFWFKIGRSDRDVNSRIADQTRSTAMPEDPIIVRVYRSESISNTELEKQFHLMLESAGHSRSESRYGGKEWFSTNLDYLDSLAKLMCLDIDEGNEWLIQG